MPRRSNRHNKPSATPPAARSAPPRNPAIRPSIAMTAAALPARSARHHRGDDNMRALISEPRNDTQAEFNRLCELGGGQRGGPARGKVCELLRASAHELNEFAYGEM